MKEFSKKFNDKINEFGIKKADQLESSKNTWALGKFQEYRELFDALREFEFPFDLFFTGQNNMPTICFETPNGNIAVLKRDDRSYYFTPCFLYYKNQNVTRIINFSTENKIDLNSPNKIGKFSSKKINDWLIYIDQYINLIDKYFIHLEQTEKKISNKINEIIQKVNGKVETSQNKTIIKKGNFIIELEHDKQYNKIREKVSFDGSVYDVIELLKPSSSI